MLCTSAARSNAPSTRPSTSNSIGRARRRYTDAKAPDSSPRCSPFTSPAPRGRCRSSRSASSPFCEKYGFPRPEVNVSIEGYLCDFLWREQRVIVETDGQRAHGTTRARRRDPIKDADLQIAGWRVIRIPSVRLFREPEAVRDQLRQLLATPAPAAPVAPHPR